MLNPMRAHEIWRSSGRLWFIIGYNFAAYNMISSHLRLDIRGLNFKFKFDLQEKNSGIFKLHHWERMRTDKSLWDCKTRARGRTKTKLDNNVLETTRVRERQREFMSTGVSMKAHENRWECVRVVESVSLRAHACLWEHTRVGESICESMKAHVSV